MRPMALTRKQAWKKCGARRPPAAAPAARGPPPAPAGDRGPSLKRVRFSSVVHCVLVPSRKEIAADCWWSPQDYAAFAASLLNEYE